MRLLLLLVACATLAGCATTSPQTRQVLKNPLDVPRKYEVSNIAFVDQVEGDCGPSALTSMLHWAGHPADFAEVRSQLVVPSKKGTLQMDLISASRRHGFMAIPIQGLQDLLLELASGHPAIIFQNLAFSWMPQWHYAVATGYDLDKQEIILLAKDQDDTRMPMTYFERHWQPANYWALLVLPANQLSKTADELSHMRAAAGLEQATKISEAETAYTQILQRWPSSLSALIGMGNIAYQKNNYSESVRFLKLAVKNHPTSESAKHNLAVVQLKLKKSKK